MSNIKNIVNKLCNLSSVTRFNIFTKSSNVREKDVIQLIQHRKKSGKTLPLPPGMKPYDPKPMPWARPPDKSGSSVLLIIPIAAFALGTWQIKRLKWKTELMEKINQRVSMEPVPLPLDEEEVAQMEFCKVEVTGTFDHDSEFLYGPRVCFVDGEPNHNIVSKTGQGSHGYNLVTPLKVSGTDERILVNRGWMRTTDVKAEKRPWSRTEGEQTITGLVRISEPPNMVAKDNEPKYNIWYTRNIEAIAEEKDTLAIWIDASVQHSIPGHLWGGQTRFQLRNEHLSYIITWYSLGVATTWMWYSKFLKR